MEIFGIVGLEIGPLLLSCFIVLMQVQVFARENRARAHVSAAAAEALKRSAMVK